MNLSSIRIDAAAIEEGRWIENIPDMDGLRLRVRGLGSLGHRAAAQKAQRGLVPADYRDRVLKPEASDRVTGQALANGVLLDWEGVDDDGKPVPYSAETALSYLTDPDLAVFREAVIWAAAQIDGKAN